MAVLLLRSGHPGQDWRHFACCFHDVTIHGRNKMQENFDLKELMEL